MNAYVVYLFHPVMYGVLAMLAFFMLEHFMVLEQASLSIPVG